MDQRLSSRLGTNKADSDYTARQQRIRDDLKKAMGDVDEVSSEYSLKVGFDLHFDYILDIPEMHQGAQVIFGIYKEGFPVIKAL